MKICILGAGIIGVTSAYFLARAGHDVIVLDKEPGSARACSYANAAQLSYTHAEPWSNPALVKDGLAWIFQKNAPLKFRLLPSLHQWRWLWQFLCQSTHKNARQNTQSIMELGLHSKAIMEAFIEEKKLDFSYTSKGIIHTFERKKNFNIAAEQQELHAKLGANYSLLTADECTQLEPAMGHAANHIVGGFIDEFDSQGACFPFVAEMEALAKELGAKFHYNETITRVAKSHNIMTHVTTEANEYEADLFVMAAGTGSVPIMRQLGHYMPIYPLKGYSITIDLPEPTMAPDRSITDEQNKIVFTKIGHQLRVAGTAEFAGFNTEHTPHRIEMLKAATKRYFPDIPDDALANAEPWACLRPSTPDGPPIIGPSQQVDNLWFNTGHGTLGWTHAMGSADWLTRMVGGEESVAHEGISPARFRL